MYRGFVLAAADPGSTPGRDLLAACHSPSLSSCFLSKSSALLSIKILKKKKKKKSKKCVFVFFSCLKVFEEGADWQRAPCVLSSLSVRKHVSNVSRFCRIQGRVSTQLWRSTSAKKNPTTRRISNTSGYWSPYYWHLTRTRNTFCLTSAITDTTCQSNSRRQRCTCPPRLCLLSARLSVSVSLGAESCVSCYCGDERCKWRQLSTWHPGSEFPRPPRGNRGVFLPSLPPLFFLFPSWNVSLSSSLFPLSL